MTYEHDESPTPSPTVLITLTNNYQNHALQIHLHTTYHHPYLPIYIPTGSRLIPLPPEDGEECTPWWRMHTSVCRGHLLCRIIETYAETFLAVRSYLHHWAMHSTAIDPLYGAAWNGRLGRCYAHGTLCREWGMLCTINSSVVIWDVITRQGLSVWRWPWHL